MASIDSSGNVHKTCWNSAKYSGLFNLWRCFNSNYALKSLLLMYKHGEKAFCAINRHKFEKFNMAAIILHIVISKSVQQNNSEYEQTRYKYD